MAGVYLTDDFSFATLGYAQATTTVATAQTLAALGVTPPAGAAQGKSYTLVSDGTEWLVITAT